MTRRAQTEMIGLVFIVVLLVFGVVLYAKFAGPGSSGTLVRDKTVEQEAKSFLITLLSADTRCGTDVEELARACLERDTAGRCANACAELQDALTVASQETLSRSGWRYNLSVEGTDATAIDSCVSADRKTLLIAAPRQEIIGSGGIPLGKALTLAVCG